MKTFTRKLAALFSFSTLGAYGLLLACAGGFWGYDYDSSFTPETFVEKSYAPLFFSANDFFYRIGFDDDYASRFNEMIVSDWANYLQGKLSRKDIQYLLLNDSAKEAANQLYATIQKKQSAPPRFNKLNLGDDKTKKFIEFVRLAKMIEASCTVDSHSWNYDQSKRPLTEFNIVREIEQHYNEATDPFLKSRYWFQTLKGYFYGPSRRYVVVFFEKTKNAVPKNVLYYRALSYVAGAHTLSKHYAVSNYLFSLVFNSCPELRTVATYNFHPGEDGNFNESLSMAKTDEEKTAMWALQGYYADEKEAIDQIYKLNPASPHLDFLLTRLVNKEEVKLNGETSFASANEFLKQVRERSSKEAVDLVTAIANEGKTRQPYLWDLAAGYLNTFQGNTRDADALFRRAEQRGHNTELAARQLRLLKLINTLFSANKIDGALESKLLSDLSWLYNTVANQNDDTFRFHHALEWSKAYLSSLYKAQGNAVFAELFHRQSDFYRNPVNLEAMKSFFQKSTKSMWEQLAVHIYNVSESDIFEYQAVMSAYDEKLDDAVRFMEQSEDGGKVELLGNPFNGKIKDCHDCDHAAPQKVKYKKLALLETMKEMQDHVEKGEDLYNNSLLLGNAFYNMTYFGNARVFYYGNIISQSGNFIDPYYQSRLLNSSIAKKYYQRAFDAATTDEQRAKCTYLMSKCERNDFYTEHYHAKLNYYGSTEVAFLAWEGFVKLKTDYTHTNYYKDVIKECGYFKKYVGE